MNEQIVTTLDEPMYFPPVLDDVKIVCIQDIDNVIYGPFSKIEILNCLKEGRLDGETKVCFRLGKDRKGKDMYAGWTTFGKSKWKGLLTVSPQWELLTNNQPLLNVNVINNNDNKSLIPLLPFYQQSTIKENQRFWFIDDGNNTHGPFYGCAIQRLTQEGLLKLSSLVYVEDGRFEWLPLKNFSL